MNTRTDIITELKVGVIGLGLIGGSFAKAYAAAGCEVYGSDINAEVIESALEAGAIMGEVTEENIGGLDLVLVALYPSAAVEWIVSHAPLFGEQATVIDLCGVKGAVCPECFRAAEEHGFTYVGGHPMAGLQFSGFRYSRDNLFKGASMIIVPPESAELELLEKIKSLLSPCEFGRITITSAKNHDAMIAYTSQMAHVVSSAYIKSPSSSMHRGYSAGSYKDLTRVAKLNEDMWSELFFANREPLLAEIDIFIKEMRKYREALYKRDKEEMTRLLREGRIAKERSDK